MLKNGRPDLNSEEISREIGANPASFHQCNSRTCYAQHPHDCYRSDNTLTKPARIAFTLRMCLRWCRPPGDSPGAGRRPR